MAMKSSPYPSQFQTIHLHLTISILPGIQPARNELDCRSGVMRPRLTPFSDPYFCQPGATDSTKPGGATDSTKTY